MAALRRTFPLLVLLLALPSLAGCGSKAGPEDPAIAVGTGIPMGAPNAAGVSFDATAAAQADPSEIGKPTAPHPLPKTLPPDPFDPMESPPPPDGGPGRMIKPPKKKGMQL